MPKRTNPFQELVTQIQRLLAAKGAKVSTSVLLKYFGIDEEREVDILIEGQWGAKTIRLAVEANAEARPMTVEGINQYIDSYRGRCGLPVTDFIIVTKNGYTSTARQVAAANNIELLTLSEARDYEWSKFLPAKPEYMTFRQAPHPCRLRSEPNEVPSEKLKQSAFVCTKCGASKDELALRPDAIGWFAVPIDPRFVLDVDGEPVEIATLHIVIHVRQRQASSVACAVYEQKSTQGPTRLVGRIAADFGDHEFSVLMPEWKDGRPPEKLLLTIKPKVAGAATVALAKPSKKGS